MALNSGRAERITNVAVLLAGLFCAASWSWYYLSAAPNGARIAAVYEAGETVDTLPQLDLDHVTEQKMLLVVLSPTCGACTESMPFLRELARQRITRGVRLTITAISKAPQSELSKYLSANGLFPDHTLEFTSNTRLKVRVTPTVILMDERRVVRGLWEGRPVPASEERLIDEIFKIVSST